MVRNALWFFIALIVTLCIASVSFADTKISALPAATTQTGVEIFPEVQSSATVGATINQIVTYVNSNASLPGSAITSGTINQNRILTCAAGQVVYDNATPVLSCNSSFAWSDANSTLSVTGGTALTPQVSAIGNAASAPVYELVDNASAADNKKWWTLASGVFGIYAVSDAGTPGQSGIQINRAGTNITQSALLAGSDNLGIKSTGDVLLNGATGTTGQTIVSAGNGSPATWGSIPAANVSGLAPSATIDTTNASNITSNTLAQARILTCAANQIVYDNASAQLSCSSSLTWTASTNTLLLSTASAVIQDYIDTSATTSTQWWRWRIDGSSATSVFHGQSLNSGGTATDWLTLTRADSANPGLVDSASILTSSGGYATNMKITADDVQFNAAENGDSVTVDIGTGDITQTANLNADATYFLINNNTGTSAYTHINLSTAGGTSFDLAEIPSTATSIGALCPGVGLPQVCFGAHGPGVGLGMVAGNGSFAVTGTAVTIGGSGSGAFTSTFGDNAASSHITNIKGGSAANTQANGVPILTGYTGTTGSIGGSALLAGACAAGTATVTGAATTGVATASPSSDPDSSLSTGIAIYAFVSAANTVTVRVCAIVAVTPTATTYNVRVIN